MKFTNKTYNLAKYVCLIGLPALATFVAAMGAIWHLDHTDQLVKTIIAFNVLASSLIVVKGVQYNNSDDRFDGVVDVVRTPPGQPDQIINVGLKNGIAVDAANGELNLKVQNHQQDAA